MSGLFAAGSAQAGFEAVDSVAGYDYHQYRIEFFAGEVADIALIGDGTTDLDLYVYDDAGNLITSESLSDIEGVTFQALTTGYYTVEVHNFGSSWNTYVLVTN
jgi:hypothetical protein